MISEFSTRVWGDPKPPLIKANKYYIIASTSGRTLIFQLMLSSVIQAEETRRHLLILVVIPEDNYGGEGLSSPPLLPKSWSQINFIGMEFIIVFYQNSLTPVGPGVWIIRGMLTVSRNRPLFWNILRKGLLFKPEYDLISFVFFISKLFETFLGFWC